MELQPVRPTVKTPESSSTGDVYMTGPRRRRAVGDDRGAGPVRPGRPHGLAPARRVAADTFMSRLARLENLPGGDDPTTWFEPVPDERYRAANQP